MKKWTHNRTGRDYFELGTGAFSSQGERVNDYDFVIGVDTPSGFKVFAKDTFNIEEHRGATFYHGQVQSADPVEFGTEMRGYKSAWDGKMWFRPMREWAERFTCVADVGLGVAVPEIGVKDIVSA